MNILLLEPYWHGSHAAWAGGYSQASRHQVQICHLPGRHWKWRMHGAAVTMARMVLDQPFFPDLILATSMLDLTTFLALTRSRLAEIPVALYFHENQITYPPSPRDRDASLERDHHYGFIQFTSALAADRVFFNSQFHLNEFCAELINIHKQYPDNRELAAAEAIKAKSAVLALGLDLNSLTQQTKGEKPAHPPRLLWNHRWEYDKNPDDFFKALEYLIQERLDFEVVIIGRQGGNVPACFNSISTDLESRIVQFGSVESRNEYAQWLWSAQIMPVTSWQEFFGISVMEGIYCGVIPLLPPRLSYPDLIPRIDFPDLYYDNFDDLCERLKQMLLALPTGVLPDLHSLAAQYDWAIMAPVYDEVLENMT